MLCCKGYFENSYSWGWGGKTYTCLLKSREIQFHENAIALCNLASALSSWNPFIDQGGCLCEWIWTCPRNLMRHLSDLRCVHGETRWDPRGPGWVGRGSGKQGSKGASRLVFPSAHTLCNLLPCSVSRTCEHHRCHSCDSVAMG